MNPKMQEEDLGEVRKVDLVEIDQGIHPGAGLTEEATVEIQETGIQEIPNQEVLEEIGEDLPEEQEVLIEDLKDQEAQVTVQEDFLEDN